MTKHPDSGYELAGQAGPESALQEAETALVTVHVTRAMINAGVEVLIGYDSERDAWPEVVAEIISACLGVGAWKISISSGAGPLERKDENA